MDDDKKATCYYKYEHEGQEKSGKTEVPEEYKHPSEVVGLSRLVRRAIKEDQPDYFLQTPQEYQIYRSGYLVGPAKIVYGWDAAFERGVESGTIDGYDFYLKAKPLKL